MQLTAQSRMLLHICMKSINNVIHVSINKQLMTLHNRFGILPQVDHGNGQKTLPHFKCLCRHGTVLQATCCPQAIG